MELTFFQTYKVNFFFPLSGSQSTALYLTRNLKKIAFFPSESLQAKEAER